MPTADPSHTFFPHWTCECGCGETFRIDPETERVIFNTPENWRKGFAVEGGK
jgi:hypothetical protein